MRINSHLLRRAAAAMLCVPAVATASAEVKYLIVSRTDGSKAAFALADDPVVKNSATELTIESTASTITVPFAELANYTFSETGFNAVDETLADESHTIRDGQITFTGLKPNSQISVYSLDGREMLRSRADADGYAAIDLGSLGKGVYIVRTNSSSFKFIAK